MYEYISYKNKTFRPFTDITMPAKLFVGQILARYQRFRATIAWKSLFNNWDSFTVL